MEQGRGALTCRWYPFHLRCRTLAASSLLPSEQVEGGQEEPPWFQSGSASGWEGLAVGLGGWLGSSWVCREFKVRRMSSRGRCKLMLPPQTPEAGTDRCYYHLQGSCELMQVTPPPSLKYA